MKIVIIIIVVLAVVFPVQSSKRRDCPTIKTKVQWGGAAAKLIDYQTIPVQCVIVHHTTSSSCDTFAACSRIVRNIQSFHFGRDFDDIGYNFLIGNDGNIYEGCGWHKVGAHTRGYNQKCIGIAFIGNFTNELPPSRALNAAKNLLRCGVSMGELGSRYKLLGARQVRNFVSPGQPIYSEIQNWNNWSRNP